MWCYLANQECYQVTCYGCTLFNPKNYIQQQFNYECPDCHGKFNYSATPAVTSDISYKCPFCGRKMVGI